MSTPTGKRTAKVKLTLTKRTVENLQPADKPWIAWDARLIGFGVRIQPSGARAFIINYRTGSGGRKARNRRIAIGRCDRLAPEEARRLAQELLGRVARRGADPAQERVDSRGMPTLREAFEEYLTANPEPGKSSSGALASQNADAGATGARCGYRIPSFGLDRLAGAPSGHRSRAGRWRLKSFRRRRDIFWLEEALAESQKAPRGR